jgi:hypothetical protein
MSLLLALAVASSISTAVTPIETKYDKVVDAIRIKGMTELRAFEMLRDLTTTVGARLSGSENDANAVIWGTKTMEALGFQSIKNMPCMVPHWVRGRFESATIIGADGDETNLNCTALGLSIGTPAGGSVAEVIEANSIAEAEKLGAAVKGKILFLSGQMPPENIRTGASYGAAVQQRVRGAAAGAKLGAIAVVIRAVSTMDDDEPHTGTMRYEDGVTRIPAAALGVKSAIRLSQALRSGKKFQLRLVLSCETLPDVPSANVIGEITGSEKPNEVIVVGGHLDSWDKGTGAHDDGAGVVHALEALRLIKELGLKPKRTIRAVLFANEESMGRGAAAYAAYAKDSKEKHIAAIESDAGGFAPRNISCSFDAKKLKRLAKWEPYLRIFEVDRLTPGGGGGADVGPLGPLGAVLFGLEPESQRYFDYHHSHNDTLDKVNPRELQLGANALALLCWMISEEGISNK